MTNSGDAIAILSSLSICEAFRDEHSRWGPMSRPATHVVGEQPSMQTGRARSGCRRCGSVATRV